MFKMLLINVLKFNKNTHVNKIVYEYRVFSFEEFDFFQNSNQFLILILERDLLISEGVLVPKG